MSFAIRVCRHCKKSVSLDATSCPSCKGSLMKPVLFKLTLCAMIGVIVIVYSGLVGAYLMLENAKDQLVCKKPFYHRDTLPEDQATCQAVCTEACQEKRSALTGSGTLLSKGYATDSLSVTLSCECTCNAC